MSTEVPAKEMVKITINLLIIYIIGGVIIAGVYAKTSPIMFIKAKEEKEAALKKMIPEADKIEELGTWEPYHHHAGYYIARVKEEDIGYIVEGFGKGYSSYINVLVALDKDLVVQKVDVLHHAETPGLGDEILNKSFITQYNGKKVEQINLTKDKAPGAAIEAITGATISSRAVTEGVREALKMLTEKMSGEVQG